MAGVKRSAPYPEWVQMYRQGLTAGRIAALCGAAQTTVRYHLQIAARAEPSLRDDHRAAAPTPARRLEIRSRQNLHDVLALYRAEQRLPRSKASSRRERTLYTWLVRRRQEFGNGTLSPTLKEALDEIGGWDTPRRAAGG